MPCSASDFCGCSHPRRGHCSDSTQAVTCQAVCVTDIVRPLSFRFSALLLRPPNWTKAGGRHLAPSISMPPPAGLLHELWHGPGKWLVPVLLGWALSAGIAITPVTDITQDYFASAYPSLRVRGGGASVKIGVCAASPPPEADAQRCLAAASAGVSVASYSDAVGSLVIFVLSAGIGRLSDEHGRRPFVLGTFLLPQVGARGPRPAPFSGAPTPAPGAALSPRPYPPPPCACPLFAVSPPFPAFPSPTPAGAPLPRRLLLERGARLVGLRGPLGLPRPQDRRARAAPLDGPRVRRGARNGRADPRRAAVAAPRTPARASPSHDGAASPRSFCSPRPLLRSAATSPTLSRRPTARAASASCSPASPERS